MSSPFIGEIIMFGGNFAPRNWAFCDGQLLSIASNTALFSILGTTYGGDGRVTFGLPEMRGRVAMHAGTGPGLTPRSLGQKGGNETTTLNTTNLPSHNHAMPQNAVDDDPNSSNLAGNVLANGPVFNTGPSDTHIEGTSATENTGGSQAYSNVQPYTCVNYIIALVGTFPSRN